MGQLAGAATIGVTSGVAPPGQLAGARPGHVVDYVATLATVLWGLAERPT